MSTIIFASFIDINVGKLIISLFICSATGQDPIVYPTLSSRNSFGSTGWEYQLPGKYSCLPTYLVLYFYS